MKLLIILLLTILNAKAQFTTQFIFLNEDKIYYIQRYNVDKFLRDIAVDKINEIAPHLVIRPSRMSDGQYALHAHVRVGQGFRPNKNSCFKKYQIHLVHPNIVVISLDTEPTSITFSIT